jgi:hypothetical protein
VFSLVLASIITVALLVTKHREHRESNSNYGVKVFFVSLIATYLLYTFMMGGLNGGQEIDVGEPPF